MTTARKPEPGPKPEFLVVEETLKCQTKKFGEISVPLDVSSEQMIELMELSEQQQFKYLCENLFPEQVRKLPFLQGFRIFTKYFEVLGELAGAPVGESSGSSN